MCLDVSRYSITKRVLFQTITRAILWYSEATFPLLMNVQHFEKNVNYNDQELITLAAKIGKLATYCKRLKDEGSAIRVEAERRDTKKERDQVKVTITVHLPKKMLRVESRRPTPLEAVDRCIEKLEPQIKRYKEMHTGKEKTRRFNKKAV